MEIEIQVEKHFGVIRFGRSIVGSAEKSPKTPYQLNILSGDGLKNEIFLDEDQMRWLESLVIAIRKKQI